MTLQLELIDSSSHTFASCLASQQLHGFTFVCVALTHSYYVTQGERDSEEHW